MIGVKEFENLTSTIFYSFWFLKGCGFFWSADASFNKIAVWIFPPLFLSFDWHWAIMVLEYNVFEEIDQNDLNKKKKMIFNRNHSNIIKVEEALNDNYSLGPF